MPWALGSVDEGLEAQMDKTSEGREQGWALGV